uniref:Cell death regulator Aven n=1 Tax=Callorhinchus milii TaxID=7868 RepID=A0A4W3IHP0_CALMI
MEPERSRGRKGGGGGGAAGRGWGQGRGRGQEPRDSHGDRQHHHHQQQQHRRPVEADRGWRGTAGRSGSRGKRQPRGRYQAQQLLQQQQQQKEDEDDVDTKEEENEPNKFSRRKIVSNWDKYKTKEKEEVEESVRGADFNVLLSSAGDSFAQFRFAEEKEWEVDIASNKQMSPLFVDCQALAQSLQELPISLRLNLEAELVQVGFILNLVAFQTALLNHR